LVPNKNQTIELTELEATIFQGIDQLGLLGFDKHSYRDQIFVGLSVSILERCHAILVLVREDKVFDAQIILRSAFEYLVEAKNIIQSDDFHWNSQADFLKGMRLKLKAAEAGNPFFASIAAKISVAEELDKLAAKTSEITELGGKNLSFERKCQAVGMQAEYDSIYRSLSNQAHPTYAGIIERHFKIDEETSDFEVRGFDPASSLSWNVVVDTGSIRNSVYEAQSMPV